MRTYHTSNLNPIWFLIAPNILIFIITLAVPEVISFLELQPANFWHQPWTIITNLFVHGGIWHIIANMVSLYFLGSFMTRLVGGKNLLKVYFIGGIIGNIFYILWAYTSWGNPSISVIGASGAIFAIGGVLTILRPNLKVLVFSYPGSFATLGGNYWRVLHYFLLPQCSLASSPRRSNIRPYRWLLL